MEKIMKGIERTFAYTVIVFLLFVFFGYWLERFNVLKTDFVTSRVSNVVNGVRFAQAQSGDGLDDDILLLERLRIAKQQEDLEGQEADLRVRENQLAVKEQELQSRENILGEVEKKVEEQKKSLNQLSKRFENRDEVLRYNVQSLSSMPPENAVEILRGYDDQLLIDTLVVADTISVENNTQSLVPYWLSLMEAGRAAEIQRKLVYRN